MSEATALMTLRTTDTVTVDAVSHDDIHTSPGPLRMRPVEDDGTAPRLLQENSERLAEASVFWRTSKAMQSGCPQRTPT